MQQVHDCCDLYLIYVADVGQIALRSVATSQYVNCIVQDIESALLRSQNQSLGKIMFFAVLTQYMGIRLCFPSALTVEDDSVLVIVPETKSKSPPSTVPWGIAVFILAAIPEKTFFSKRLIL